MASSHKHYLNEAELKKALHFLFDNHKGPGNPMMDNVSAEEKEAAIDGLAKQLLSHRRIDMNELRNPRFENNLAIALATTLAVNKNFSLEKWRNEIKQIMQRFDPKEMNELAAKLRPEIKAAYKGLMLELLYAKLAKPIPGDKKIDAATLAETQAEALAEDFIHGQNKYSNMTGLISETEGAIAVPILVFLGAPGFIDWNPFHETSSAPIAAQDKLSDTQGGDPLGLNHAAGLNYLSGSGKPELLQQLLDAGALSNAPQLRQ